MSRWQYFATLGIVSLKHGKAASPGWSLDVSTASLDSISPCVRHSPSGVGGLIDIISTHNEFYHYNHAVMQNVNFIASMSFFWFYCCYEDILAL